MARIRYEPRLTYKLESWGVGQIHEKRGVIQSLDDTRRGDEGGKRRLQLFKHRASGGSVPVNELSSDTTTMAIKVTVLGLVRLKHVLDVQCTIIVLSLKSYFICL